MVIFSGQAPLRVIGGIGILRTAAPNKIFLTLNGTSGLLTFTHKPPSPSTYSGRCKYGRRIVCPVTPTETSDRPIVWSYLLAELASLALRKTQFALGFPPILQMFPVLGFVVLMERLRATVLRGSVEADLGWFQTSTLKPPLVWLPLATRLHTSIEPSHSRLRNPCNI